MLRQIRLLSGVQLINLFGINEIRHTKDRGKKARYAWLSVAWLMVILMLVFYVAVFSAAFVKLGMAEIIPVYLFLTTSLVILCFTFLRREA